MKIKISTRVIVITSLAIIASSGIYFYEKQNRELESQQSKALPAKALESQRKTRHGVKRI